MPKKDFIKVILLKKSVIFPSKDFVALVKSFYNFVRFPMNCSTLRFSSLKENWRE